MHGRRRRTLRLGAALILAMGILGVGASGAAAIPGWLTDLDGQSVVPGPGDPDGSGLANVSSLRPTDGEICWQLTVSEIDTVTAIQVLHGAGDAAGSVTLDLPLTVDADGRFADCLSGQDQAVLQDIADHPGDYAFQVATSAFPGGAIRGQLAGLDVVERISAGVMLCPREIESFQQAQIAGAGGPSTAGEFNVCAPTGPVGRVPAVPDGYHWLLDPVETNLELSVRPAGSTPRTTDSATFQFGNGSCDTVSLVCTGFGWFDWASVPVGTVVVRLDGNGGGGPAGYQGAWQEISINDGPLEYSAQGNQALELSGSDTAFVWFFERPWGPETNVPTLPSLTPPPTSTISGHADAVGSVDLVALLLGASGLVALASTRRLRRHD